MKRMPMFLTKLVDLLEEFKADLEYHTDDDGVWVVLPQEPSFNLGHFDAYSPSGFEDLRRKITTTFPTEECVSNEPHES